MTLGATLAALALIHQVDLYRRGAAVKVDALAQCAGDSDCRTRVIENHAECFRLNDGKGQSRFSPGAFDAVGYAACLNAGAKAWRRPPRLGATGETTENL